MSDAGFGDSKLGGLPSLGYGPVTAQPVQVPNTDATVAAWNRVGAQAQQIGDNYLKQQATIQGSQAGSATQVTKDANGNIQYANLPSLRFPLTEADEAYNNAAQAGVLARSQLAARTAIANIQQTHAGDPAGFSSAIDDMTGKMLDQLPAAYQPAIRNMINQEAGEAQSQLERQQFYATVEESKNDTIALARSNFDILAGQARAGQYDPNNPTLYQQSLLGQIAAQEQKLKGNPSIALSPEESQWFGQVPSLLVGQQVLGNARKDYAQYGEAEAENRVVQAANDPTLRLSPDERQQIQSQGLAEIRMLDGQTKSNRLEQQQAVEYQADDALAKAKATGDYSSILTDAQIRSAYANNPARADQLIETLHGAVETYGMRGQVALATPADIKTLDAKYNPATPGNGARAPAPTMSVGQAIFGQESSFGKNAGPSVDGSSIGPMQIKPSTFVEYAKPGESIDNPKDNYAVGQRIIADYEQRWPNDPARVATAYFSGPGNVAPASSPTPWIRDAADANGKTVSGYVGDVLDRMGVQQGSTFAAQQRTYQAFQTAVAERNKALASDPNGYVLAQRPDIKQQVSAQDPATVQQGVRASLQVQKDLGVAQPQVLTSAQGRFWVNRFQNPTDQSGNPIPRNADTMIGTLRDMQGLLGSYYPQALAQISKGLPPDVSLLDWTKDDKDGVAARAANAVNTGRQALDKAIPSGQGAQLDQEIQSGLSDFNASVKGFGGSAFTSKMGQAVGLYARQLMAEGMGAPEAATQAVHDIVGKNYTFEDTYRVPTGIDANGVAKGASALRNSLPADALEPYAQAGKGVPLSQRQTLSQNILRSQGVWLTLPNDSGLYLAWPAQSGYLGAKDAQGHPITYSWPELIAAGSRLGAQPAPPGLPQLGLR